MVSFIVVDDSELDRFVTQNFLKRSDESLIINTFHDARDVLELIRENSKQPDPNPAIILLDLQMPFMNGFEFVEEFEKFPAEIKEKYTIIILTILSPDNNPGDIFRIYNFGAVKSIIEKPLTKEKLLTLLSHIKPAN